MPLAILRSAVEAVEPLRLRPSSRSTAWPSARQAGSAFPSTSHVLPASHRKQWRAPACAAKKSQRWMSHHQCHVTTPQAVSCHTDYIQCLRICLLPCSHLFPQSASDTSPACEAPLHMQRELWSETKQGRIERLVLLGLCHVIIG
jgi:hypothetical protein